MSDRKRYTGTKTRSKRERYTGKRSGGDGGSPGVFGVVKNLGVDLKDAAINLPAGVWEMADSTTSDVADALNGDTDFDRSKKLGGDIADQYAHTYGPLAQGDFGEFAHRVGQHPLGPVLDVVSAVTLGAGAPAKAGQVGSAVGVANKAKALVTKVQPGPRTLRVGELEVQGQFSRNAAVRGVQKATDSLLTRGAEANPAGRIADRRNARASRWEERGRRVEETVARAKASQLMVVGRKLKPEEQMALRLVAEEAPVGRRIAASELRAARMDEKGQARHGERIGLMRKAQDLLDEGPDGRPVVKADQKKLARVYALLRETSSDRESMLMSIDRMTPEGAAKHKTDVGQVALGAEYVDPKVAAARARDIEREGGRTAAQVARDAKREQRKARREAARLAGEAQRADREWFRLSTTRGADEKAALADEKQIIRQVEPLGRPEPVLPIETGRVPRTEADVVARIGELETWLEPRLKRVRAVGVDDVKRNMGDKAFSGQGPKPDAVDIFPEVQGSKDPLSIIAKTSPTLNPRVRARQEGLIPQRGLAPRITQGWAENRAINDFYKTAKASSHPSLRAIADRMDELDELRDLVARKQRSESFMADEEGPFPGFGEKIERQSDPVPESPPKPELLDEDLGAVAAARRQVEDAERAREARIAEARRRADENRQQADAAYKVAGDASRGRREAEAARQQAAARAQAELERGGTFEGADDFEASPDAVYIGDPQKRSKLTGRPKVPGRIIGNPRSPDSLTKGYTGRSKAAALERLDTTKIVAERNLEAVRLTSMLRLRDRMAKAGTEAPTRVDDVFVRLDNNFERDLLLDETGGTGPLRPTGETPNLVRQYLEDPESLTTDDPMHAGQVIDRIRDSIFQDGWALDPGKRAQFEQLAEQGLGVFVPKRLLGDLAKQDPRLQDIIGTRATNFIDAVNNATKAAVIYLKPAYAPPQMLSNLFLNIVHEGWSAPFNLKRAVLVDKKLTASGHVGVVDDLMGEGAVRMLGGEGQGPLGRFTRATAGTLSRVVDTPFRRAAWIHEARKAGFKSPDQMIDLLDNPAHRSQLTEVTMRANQAMVDFGEMSPLERSIIRRVVFVYPWVKGSSLLAGRTLRDNPVQASVGARVAAVGQERAEEDLGPVPSYLEGTFSVGGKLVNPASLSPYGTAAQVGQGIAGTLSGNVPNVAEWQQFSSPVLSLATALATRKDSIGRPLHGQSLPEVAYNELVGSTPQAAVIKALLGDPRRTGTFPDPDGTDAYWRFLLGGLYPREYSRSTLNTNARREAEGR